MTRRQRIDDLTRLAQPALAPGGTVVAGDLYAIRQPESRIWSPVTFFALPTGERYVHLGLRATPKVA